MGIDREIVENLGAEHTGINGYTGDYRFGSSLYGSPSRCLDGILGMWLYDVDEGDPEELAKELVDMYGDPSGLVAEHMERIEEKIENHLR